MAKSFVFFLLCVSSVYSDMQMNADEKNMMSEKMDDTNVQSVMVKLKRDSWPYHSTPCPPYQHSHGYMPEHPKIQYVQQPQYVHKPVVTVVKPHVPVHQPSYGYNKQGWQKPSYVVQKPIYSYLPQYHKPMYQPIPSYHQNIIKPAVVVKPDCPPYQHQHPHTGIVYAPQHQYQHQTQIKYVHQEPQYVKVAQPAYHPPPVYHHPEPVYHRPAPIYHHPASVYHPKVEICDK